MNGCNHVKCIVTGFLVVDRIGALDLFDCSAVHARLPCQRDPCQRDTR